MQVVHVVVDREAACAVFHIVQLKVRVAVVGGHAVASLPSGALDMDAADAAGFRSDLFVHFHENCVCVGKSVVLGFLRFKIRSGLGRYAIK